MLVIVFTLTAFVFGAMLLSRLLMTKKRNDEQQKHEEKELMELRAVNHKLSAIYLAILEIRDAIREKRILTSARVNLMSKTIQVGQTSLATIQGFDQNGNPFPLDASYQVAYAASVPGDVSVASPAPDGSAVITGVNPDTGDVIGATITRPDGSTLTAGTDTLVIEQAPPPPPVLTTANVVLT